MLDPLRVPSPCFVLEEDAFRRNLAVIADVQRRAGVRFLLALKGFAMWRVFPWVREVVAGATASSLHEARLAFEELGGEVHAYAPAYREKEWEALLGCCTHVTFNSLAQQARFGPRSAGRSCGLRINPEYSPVPTALYNPCAEGSRLGIRAEALAAGLPAGIEGLHSHNLCESDSLALERTLAQIERLFGHLLGEARWLNLGGGHLVTAATYDRDHAVRTLREFGGRHPGLAVFLEPGSAFAWQAGVLVATVEDIVTNGPIRTAVLDTSFATHMPDCLEMPYRPAVRGAVAPAGEGVHVYRLGGISCLAGDFVGDYGFREPLRPGDRLVFEDMLHYTMVKTTTFNGVNLPAIGIWHADDTFECVRRFGYADYRSRLS
ncbi:MAG: carboxynorspermidine decarboxylase [Lentisphaeria bacterium]|nr:carboxynorspermidine decarboxylase [Lentisphaeria bacterium]